MKGASKVASASVPSAKATPKAMANAHVGQAKVQELSAGKMASAPGVKLGTTHGNDKVNHAV